MAQLDRAQARGVLDRGHAALDARLAGLSVEEMCRDGALGGWSVKQLISHIAFWEELALEAIGAWRAGNRPAAETIFERGATGTDEANAADEALWAPRSLDEVLARSASARASLLAALDTLSDSDWHTRAPYTTSRRETLGVLIGSILGAPKRPFDHVAAHLPDLDAYITTLKQ